MAIKLEKGQRINLEKESGTKLTKPVGGIKKPPEN